MVLIIVMTGRATVHRITWYLAVDQFGYLTFATDLMHGRITHEWSVAKALASVLPPHTDMLAQTYVWDAGKMYCRYAAGFPLLLASWMTFFGDLNVHYLNPTLYLVFVVVYAMVATRLLGDRWRALVALGLLLLLPTFTHLWALTITRDLAAHLFAWIGFWCVLPGANRTLTVRRVGLAGIAIGFCSSIRPDDIMYALPAFLLAVSWWRQHHTPAATVRASLAAGAGMIVVGLLPFFIGNWAATGNPFWPTQGMELNMLTQPIGASNSADAPAGPAPVPGEQKVGYPSPGWHGGFATQVQGGGLRLANLPKTLPGLFALLNRGYSAAFMGLAVWGLVLATVQRPLLILGAVPYAVTALLLYGCWSRPDTRYVLGVHYLMPLMITEGLFGIFDLRKLFPDAAGSSRTAWAVVALVAAMILLVLAAVTPTPIGFEKTPLPILMRWIVLPGVALGLLCAAMWPAQRFDVWVACVLAVVLAGYVSKQSAEVTGTPRNAGFQRPQMERARATLQSKLPPNSVILTTEDIGRPMENIQYYSGVAQSIYWTDIMRWRLPVQVIAREFAKSGMQLYWMMPSADAQSIQRTLAFMSGYSQIDKVMEIPPDKAMDWFVAAAFHRGLKLDLYKVSPKTK